METVRGKWFVSILRSKRILLIAVCTGTVLSLPSLFSGFIADDHVLECQSKKGPILFNREPAELFNLASSDNEVARMRERGVLPWWTPDSFRINSFRPLASLVHALQFHLFGESAWIMHAIVILMYTGLILTTAYLLKNISGPGLVPGLGMILFAINDTHGYSVGWISSQNTLATCLLGYLSLLLHIQWIKSNRPGSAVGAALLFAASLGFSEGGLALLGYLIPFTVFISTGTMRKRIGSLLPYVLIAAAYLLMYKVNGYGIRGSGAYLDPGSDTVTALGAILSNTPLLVLSQIISLPPLTMTISMFSWGGALAAVVLAGLYYLLRDFFRENSNARFYGAGSILTAIPFTLSGTQDRLLLWAGLGGAGLLAELYSWMISREQVKKGVRRITNGLLLTNVFVSLLFFVPSTFFYMMIESCAAKIEKGIGENNAIVVNAPMDVFFIYPPVMRQKGTWPAHVHLLYCGADTVEVRRIDDHTITVSSEKGWFATPMERFARSKAFPFVIGDTVELESMTARIVTCSHDGRPLTVQFTFTKPLNAFDWYRWETSGPVRFDLPDVDKPVRLLAKLF